MRNLRSFDMNLLAALEAFVSERNVTRAAGRLGLSQPAASNMLQRLRVLFQDELLVRTPTGMSPTPRALEIYEELQPTLARIQKIFESSISFDPASSVNQFRLRLSDLLESLILPALTVRFTRQAPCASLGVVHLPPVETVDALEKEKLDIAVSTGLSCPSSIRSKLLYRDRMVCIMRKQHPRARRPMTIERFVAENHIRVSMSATDERFVEGALRKLNMTRRIALHVQHWGVVESILREGDLLCVMPESFAMRFGPDFRRCPLPFERSEFDWEIYWHSRNDNSPSRRWLTGLIEQCKPKHEAALTGRRAASNC